MGSHKSPEEIYEEFLRACGPRLAPFFYAFFKELASLHDKWHTYRVLFGTTPERFDFLYEMAPGFFRTIEDALWDDVLLHIARLTDDAKRNLSVKQLPALVKGTPIRTVVVSRVRAALDAAAFLIEWRNKGLAHLDLRHATGQESRRLTRGSRKDVETSLATLRDVFHSVEEHFLKSETAFEHTQGLGGAETLVYRLAVAREAERARARRFEQGCPLPEDLQWPPAI